MGTEDEPPRGDELFVSDITAARRLARNPAQDLSAGGVFAEARNALWELDFALTELDWLSLGVAAPDPLVESVAAQIALACRFVQRFPVSPEPLPEDLSLDLADRYDRLGAAIDGLPGRVRDHAELKPHWERLGEALRLRGVELD